MYVCVCVCVCVWFVVRIWIMCVEVREEYDVEEVYVCDFPK